MIEKRILTYSDVVLAVKFHARDGILTIGGYSRFRGPIEQLLIDYFEVKRPNDPIYTQKNKVRFVLTCTKKRFYDAMKRMQEDGVRVEVTNILHRIMR